MKKEPLGIQHKSILSSRLRDVSVRLSEFSFANLFLFRETHKYEVAVDDEGCIFITGLTNDKCPFVLPLCEKKKPDIEDIRNMISEFNMLYPISDSWIGIFDPREFEVWHNEDDSDYIYKVEKMATYSGRHLSKKRNLLKQFHAEHSYERLELVPEIRKQAQGILRTWQDEMPLGEDETDYKSAVEALEYMDELDLGGYLYIIDGAPGGYVLGEHITDDTYALHFAKALTRYKGVYQFMYNDLAKHLLGHATYMNFEQDLGLQSLRQAKASYKPDHMGMKYRVTFKSEM